MEYDTTRKINRLYWNVFNCNITFKYRKDDFRLKMHERIHLVMRTHWNLVTILQKI